MAINADYRKSYTVLKDFKDANFAGLTRQVIKPLESALEHTKRIHRFWNDDNVDTENYDYPTLYEHIFSGLAYAQEDIFNRIEKLKVATKPGFRKKLNEFAEKFNRAFLVHDFGEMFMEFSTVAGRHNKKEGSKDKQLRKEERDSIERKIAKLVFNSVHIVKARIFSLFFSEKSQAIATTDKYDKKIELAQKFASDGERMVRSFKAALSDSAEYINDFVRQWMSDYDISQKDSNLKDSFIGNMVKVVDKLEDVWRAAQIHDPKKLTDHFKHVIISSYIKAYAKLRACTEAQKSKEGSVEQAVLKQIDRLVRIQFEKDNKAIKKSSGYKFDSFDQAKSVGLALPI